MLKASTKEKITQLQGLFKNAVTKSFQAHNSKIHSVAWNVDGRRLASGSTDKTVAVFTFENKEKLVDMIILHALQFPCLFVNFIFYSPKKALLKAIQI